MFCPNCGIENPDNGKFCRSCGANIINVLAVMHGTVPELNESAGKEDYAELYSTGVRNTILGAGFLVTSVFLFTLPGNTFFWLLAMIPAFFLIASGVKKILKSEELKKQIMFRSLPRSFPNVPNKQFLPAQSDYVKPQKTIYETDELNGEPLSVTEDTTNRLTTNHESETMTLSKN